MSGAQKVRKTMMRIVRLAATVAVVGALTLGCAAPGGPIARTADDVLASEATARLEKALAVDGLTVADVAAFVFQYGWTLVPAPLPTWHWGPAAEGSAPISYYLFEIRGAVGDTTMVTYFPQVAGAYRVRVAAVDDNGATGIWSDAGWSNGRNGRGALIGVALPAAGGGK